MTLNPSWDDLLPETIERLPYPIGFCWLQATRPNATFSIATACAEHVVRTIYAIVLADVMDIQWSATLDSAFRASSLKQLSFGKRLDGLGALIAAHERTLKRPGRVLPPLTAWWKSWEAPWRHLVACRNAQAHKAGIMKEPPLDGFSAELGCAIRGARWLQQVQLVLVKTARSKQDATVADTVRLRGSAPHRREGSAQVPWSAPVTGDTVYLGRADGKVWRPVHGMRAGGDALLDGRIIELFDGVDAHGKARFLNPEDPTLALPEDEATNAKYYQLHLPGRREPLLWDEFVAQRQSATWTLLEPQPHPGLVLRDLPLDISAAPGKEIHGYRLVKRLGQGDRASVWEAQEVATGRPYALKFLCGEAAESPTERERLLREIHWLKRLEERRCPHVIHSIEAVGAPDARDGLLVRMPLFRSNLQNRATTLREQLSSERFETKVIRWGVQALETLEALGVAGVVHRDIRTQNFLVDDHDDLVLADFGRVSLPADEAATKGPVLTRLGDSKGYQLGPEALGNPSEATPASDVHALAGALRSVLGRVQPSPELQQLLHAMAARDPAQRPTASEALARMRALGAPAGPAPSASWLSTAPPSSSSLPSASSLPTAPPSVQPPAPPDHSPSPASAPSTAPQPPRAPAAPPPPAPSSAFAVPASAGVVFGPSPTPYPLPPGHAPPGHGLAPWPASPPVQSAIDARTPPPVAPPTHSPQLARSGAPSAAPASLGKWVAAGVALVGLAAGATWAASAGGKRSASPREPVPASTPRAATTAPARPPAPPSCPDGMVGLAGATVTLSAPEGATEPSRAVAVAPLCIDRTEVTVAAYAACVGRGQCTKAASGPHCNEGDQARLDHPANCVVWRQADAYCRAQGKRLPTSDEWEYAARGLDGREFPWGSEPPTGRVCGGQEGTCAVASMPAGASPSGALGMAGNVHEWTSTRASSNDGLHEYRGGSWTEKGLLRLRAALRAKAGPDHQRHDIGFRCARSATP